MAEGKGDVVACSYFISTMQTRKNCYEVTFLFANNPGMSQTRFGHVRTLIKMIKDESKGSEFIELIETFCREKIVERALSLARKVGLSAANLKPNTSNFFNLHPATNPVHQSLARHLAIKGCMTKEQNLVPFIDKWARDLARAKSSKKHPDLRDMLIVAYEMTNFFDHFKSVYNQDIIMPDQTRKIARLGRLCEGEHAIQSSENILEESEHLDHPQRLR